MTSGSPSKAEVSELGQSARCQGPGEMAIAQRAASIEAEVGEPRVGVLLQCLFQLRATLGVNIFEFQVELGDDRAAGGVLQALHQMLALFFGNASLD